MPPSLEADDRSASQKFLAFHGGKYKGKPILVKSREGP
jgi:hypothetical protein